MGFGLWSDEDGDFPAARPEQLAEVPAGRDVTPDGRDALVSGDVSRLDDARPRQGDNPFGFLGTCGICSCREVLRQFGVEVTEAELVDHAVRNGLCHISDDPFFCGGTTPSDRLRILNDYGISARTEFATGLDELARDVDGGHGVIIAANAGVLRDNPAFYDGGAPNHAVVVMAVSRDAASGEINGFFVNDSAAGGPSSFVDAETMRAAWLEAGGIRQVTDATWTKQRNAQ